MASRVKRRRAPDRTTSIEVVEKVQPKPARQVPLESLGWTGLLALSIYFLAVSWRKWPDPLIDFGRELYLPWRITHGALLYRDVDDFFGPLSQYLNAGLFALFGPGMMVLVIANLAVFAGIVICLYLILRKAWGVAAALVSSALFISVFGFGQYVGIGNYNYATPYSHETTHGMLACLLLVLVLCRWVEEPSQLRSALAGTLFGLAAVLKPESFVAAVVISLGALGLRWRTGKPVRLSHIAVWSVCAAAPTGVFAAYFSVHVPWTDAWKYACRAWLYLAALRHGGGEIQQSNFGFQSLWHNLAEHLIATVAALLTFAILGGIAWQADRSASGGKRLALAGVLTASMLWLGVSEISWMNAGRCLLGLTLIYFAISAAPVLRRSTAQALDQVAVLRILFTILAGSMMGRMILNGRIYHYGFYQAALAAVLMPAILIGELPVRLTLGRWGRNLILAGTVVLLGPGVAIVASASQDILDQKTYPVGEGRDRFYSFPPEVEPNGAIVRALTERLSKAPPGQTLLVLPEGEMINYLSRMPSPVAPFIFYSAATTHGQEAILVKELQSHPPDWVAVVSRDLREYGIERYGEAPGRGEQLLRWASENYEQELQVGGDPLKPGQVGGLLLRRKLRSSALP